MPIELVAVDRKTRRPRTDLAVIHDDVKQAVEETLEYCTENPGKAITAQFDTQAEAEDFLHDAKSYAFHRDPQVIVTGVANKNGIARFDVAAKPEA